MMGRSPNEIANELSRLNRDARLRRLKAVRSAASRVQQERLSSFRKHFDREKMVVEETAHIERARITLADISALEDELRLALSQMGAAHQNALTFSAQITEEMLRQNKSFKAHVTMSNLRFEAAIELIRAFRHQQQILKSAPAEQRAIAFQRAKELLQKIAAINERAKSRYAEMSPSHPYDCIHELTPSEPVDFRVTRIHVDATAADAVSLARVEDERYRQRMKQAEMLRQRQSQVAERRAEVAADAVQSRRTATEVQASLQEALVQDRQRKLQLARQRSALPPRPKQSKIKRAFEAALPELCAAQREQRVRQAQRQLQQRSRTGSSSSNIIRPESPDDLLERFAGSEDAAVIPNNLLRNIVNIIDDQDADERKEVDQASAEPVHNLSHDTPVSTDAGNMNLGMQERAEEGRERKDPASTPAVAVAPVSDTNASSIIIEERRPVAFTVTFSEERPRSRANRRSSSPESLSPSTSQSSALESLHPSTRQTLSKAQLQSELVIIPSPTVPSETSRPDANELLAATVPSEQDITGSGSVAEPAPGPEAITNRSSSPSNEDSKPDVADPCLSVPVEHDQEEAALSDRLESGLPHRTSGDESESAIDSSESKPILALSPSLSSVAHDTTNDLSVDTLLPSIDLSLDDLTELDRRAEELLRSHIPTTPQLLALSRGPDQSAFDFRLDEDGDDYTIQLLGVDSEELAASFAQTLDETLEFLRQSRQEIDNLRKTSE